MFAAGLGQPEVIIIAIVIIVLFGSSALPKFARSLGQAKKEFESGVTEGTKKDDTDKKEEK